MSNRSKYRLATPLAAAAIAILAFIAPPASAGSALNGNQDPARAVADGASLPVAGVLHGRPQTWFSHLADAGQAMLRMANDALYAGLVDASAVTASTTSTRTKPQAAQRSRPPASVFGSVAIAFQRLPALERLKPIYSEMGARRYLDCDGMRCPAPQNQIAADLSGQGSQGFLAKINAVNKAVNRRITYARDTDTFGVTDYWATPGQTLERGLGDCEDYAILKMALLAELGIPISSMSVVILNDDRRNLFHAVLAVKTDRGFYVLDNVHDQLKLDSDIAHYSPLYSISSGKGFIHGRRIGGAQIAGGVRLETVAPGEGPYPVVPAGGEAR